MHPHPRYGEHLSDEFYSFALFFMLPVVLSLFFSSSTMILSPVAREVERDAVALIQLLVESQSVFSAPQLAAQLASLESHMLLPLSPACFSYFPALPFPQQ